MSDPSATADPLEPFRGYLGVLAGLHLDRRLQGKLDVSDVVQQTMLRAHVALPDLRDRSPDVLAAWLRQPPELTIEYHLRMRSEQP